MNPSEKNVSKIKKALLYLSGQVAKELNIADVMEYPVVRVADEIVVDLLEKACDVTFEEAKNHIVYETIKDVRIPYLDIELLIKTK